MRWKARGGGHLADVAAGVVAGGLEQDVGGLEVAVQDSKHVQVAHSECHVLETGQHHFLRTAPQGHVIPAVPVPFPHTGE